MTIQERMRKAFVHLEPGTVWPRESTQVAFIEWMTKGGKLCLEGEAMLKVVFDEGEGLGVWEGWVLFRPRIQQSIENYVFDIKELFIIEKDM